MKFTKNPHKYFREHCPFRVQPSNHSDVWLLSHLIRGHLGPQRGAHHTFVYEGEGRYQSYKEYTPSIKGPAFELLANHEKTMFTLITVS